MSESLCRGETVSGKSCSCGLTQVQLRDAGIGIFGICTTCKHVFGEHPSGQQQADSGVDSGVGAGGAAAPVVLVQPVTCVLPVALSPNACPQLIGVTETVDWIYDHIMLQIEAETDSFMRKTVFMISRCPRGGKTTILYHLHKFFAESKVNAITVSFNGVSGFLRVTGETPSDSLFRLITNQLNLEIDKQSPRVTDWNMLDVHIGDEKFVLMIDELNVLCNTVDSELAGVLKKFFLDKANRHLVVTSHQPFLMVESVVAVDGDANAGHGAAAGVHKFWSDSVAALSERSLMLVPMPLCRDVDLLRAMSPLRCSRITHSLAAFYGYMPSLMYAVCIQPEESPSAKFSRVVQGTSNDFEQLLKFVQALISGIPSPSLQRFFCFSSGVECTGALGVRMKWPLCYVSCILRHFPGRELYEDIAKFIDALELNCETVGDGMAWEKSISIAVLLKFIAAAKLGWDLPFKLCKADEAKDAGIEVLYLGPNVTTVDDAKKVIDDNKVQFCSNTLILYVPTKATLQQFDGFCVRYQDAKVRNVCGFQCKDSKKGAVGMVPKWITQGGHLLRSDAPSMCRHVGQKSTGWTYYNADDTDDFLGWSLRMMRR